MKSSNFDISDRAVWMMTQITKSPQFISTNWRSSEQINFMEQALLIPPRLANYLRRRMSQSDAPEVIPSKLRQCLSLTSDVWLCDLLLLTKNIVSIDFINLKDSSTEMRKVHFYYSNPVFFVAIEYPWKMEHLSPINVFCVLD
jgi:hypothetical protein